MKTVLVTGGAGFIGTNFIKWLISKSDYQIINLDLLTYAGNLENLKDIEDNNRYRFIKGNICDNNLLSSIFNEYAVISVVNFAAESHVDRSIDSPEIFYRTNVMGTLSLLEAARKYWKDDPEDKYDRKFKDDVRFIQVSTDEVYGSLDNGSFFTEETAIDPSSPYSSSKASADILVKVYWKTYGLPSIITRCSNNYGPYQHPEKLIPLAISKAMKNEKIPVYGNGNQIRDWIHVDDHCKALCAVLREGKPGEIYNIGAKNETRNIDIIKLILRYMDKDDDLIEYIKDRPGHDKRYAIDNTKISTELGWIPNHTLQEGIVSTIKWYASHEKWLKNVLSGEYAVYYEKMYKK